MTSPREAARGKTCEAAKGRARHLLIQGVIRLGGTLLIAVATNADAHPSRPSASAGWDSYANARFGYQICYPRALLKPQREADNGDGRHFLGVDGADLAVFGSNNALKASLSDEARSQAHTLLGAHGEVSYHVARPTWEVTSGNDGKRFAFYAKTFLRDDQFVTFEFRYPLRAAIRYKPIVERLSRCFTIGRPTF